MAIGEDLNETSLYKYKTREDLTKAENHLLEYLINIERDERSFIEQYS